MGIIKGKSLKQILHIFHHFPPSFHSCSLAAPFGAESEFSQPFFSLPKEKQRRHLCHGKQRNPQKQDHLSKTGGAGLSWHWKKCYYDRVLRIEPENPNRFVAGSIRVASKSNRNQDGSNRKIAENGSFEFEN